MFGVCHTEFAIGCKSWGAHHRHGSVRDKIGICFPVLHAGLLRVKRTNQNKTLLMGKKKKDLVFNEPESQSL